MATQVVPATTSTTNTTWSARTTATGRAGSEVRTTRRRRAARSRPSTSIVVPVYNAAETLPRCLASLAAQMRPDVQLVLVDDASADASPLLLAQFAADHPEWDVEVVTQRCNRGAGWARRCGFEVSTGTYLYWLDADDQLADGALDRIRRAERALGGPGTILVFDLVVHRPDGSTVEEPGMHDAEVCGAAASVDALLRSSVSWYLWNKVVPRAGVTADMFSTSRRGEDLLTLLELSRVHPRFQRVPEPLVTYSQSPTSLSQSLAGFDQYLDHDHGVLAEVRAAVDRLGLTTPCRTSLELCFVLRTLANSAVLGARRTSSDADFRRLARRLVRSTTLRSMAVGLHRGDRQAAVGLALLALSPAAFQRVAAGRKARQWRAAAPDARAPGLALNC